MSVTLKLPLPALAILMATAGLASAGGADARWEPADIAGFKPSVSQGYNLPAGASTSASVFDTEIGVGDKEASSFASLKGGGHFGYQCFHVSKGSWANWQHWLWVDEVQGDWDWLTNLDLVSEPDLYSGTVAPYVYTDHAGRLLPGPPGNPGTTAQTDVCARWIVQRPAEGDRPSITLKLGSTNIDGNNRNADPAVMRIKEMELAPRR